jgi:hypothetical protein
LLSVLQFADESDESDVTVDEGEQHWFLQHGDAQSLQSPLEIMDDNELFSASKAFPLVTMLHFNRSGTCATSFFVELTPSVSTLCPFINFLWKNLVNAGYSCFSGQETFNVEPVLSRSVVNDSVFVSALQNLLPLLPSLLLQVPMTVRVECSE